MEGEASEPAWGRLAKPSYWLSQPAGPARTPLEADISTDLAIVGGGFTGLWSAIHLAEAVPGARIVVLEAREVGFGASGRNGGFAMTMVGRNLHDLVRKVGPGAARRVHLEMVAALGEIERFCAAEAIDCQLSHPGILTVSNGPEQDLRIEQDLRAARLSGLDDFRAVSGPECREMVRAQGVRRGHFEEHGLLLDPAALARGLRDAAERRGVEIYENTPVTHIDAHPYRVQLATSRARVDSRQVLVATNAYARVVPRLRRYLFTVCAYITLSAPLSRQQWDRVGWAGGMGIEDKRIMPHFHRPTADGRILWGGRDAPLLAGPPDPSRDSDPRIFQRLAETFRETFPQLSDVRLEYGWGGPVGGTVACLPHAGWLERGRVLYALGYSGHGVGPSALMGKVVRDLLLGRETALTNLPLVTRRLTPLPPPPLQAKVLQLSQRVLQRSDDLGGNAGPLAHLALRLLQ
jgi:glycine/D-amino acid oxidase-like deaminating enzyme